MFWLLQRQAPQRPYYKETVPRRYWTNGA